MTLLREMTGCGVSQLHLSGLGRPSRDMIVFFVGSRVRHKCSLLCNFKLRLFTASHGIDSSLMPQSGINCYTYV